MRFAIKSQDGIQIEFEVCSLLVAVASTYTRCSTGCAVKASSQDRHCTRCAEFGSQIYATHGLLAASEQLRHANIQTSTQHYIENRRRATPGLGRLLKSERTIVPMREATSA